MTSYTDITDDFYDNRTHNILQKHSNDNNLTAEQLFSKWRTIVCSFPYNYIIEYSSLTTNHARNDWFEKYLNLPTHDMAEMPYSLL